MNEGILADLQLKLLKYLSYKPRTVNEISRKGLEVLRSEEDLPDDERNLLIEKVIQDFTKTGFLNDKDYALSYIEEQKKKSIPKGPRYINQFLRKKGIPQKLCEESLNQGLPPDEERKLIQKILNKSKSKEPAKMISYLQQKGFNYAVICSLVDRNPEKN